MGYTRTSIYPQQEPHFYEWFVRNEVDVIKTSMLSSVRVKAGLGSPPMPYTTNRSESMNKVVKASADYQKLSWVQLADKMFSLINSQIKEIEKAVIGMGEYRFKPSYRCLELSSSKCFTMSTREALEKGFSKMTCAY